MLNVGAVFVPELSIVIVVVAVEKTKEAALSPPMFRVIGKEVTLMVELVQKDTQR